MADITRADLIDFRARIVGQSAGPNTTNKVLETLKIIFKEALFREDIGRDPTVGLGPMKYKRKEAGIFTPDELAMLFPADDLGPWLTIQEYACFLLASTTGMRRGELLALRWRNVDIGAKLVRVVDAWKGHHDGADVYGEPKWGSTRETPIPAVTAGVLVALRNKSSRREPLDFVFSGRDGAMLGETWWRKAFVRAMQRLGIDYQARGLKPHSFRHTLNTMLRAQGVDSQLLRQVFGWTNARTQDGYTHLTAEDGRAVAAQIDGLFCRN